MSNNYFVDTSHIMSFTMHTTKYNEWLFCRLIWICLQYFTGFERSVWSDIFTDPISLHAPKETYWSSEGIFEVCKTCDTYGQLHEQSTLYLTDILEVYIVWLRLFRIIPQSFQHDHQIEFLAIYKHLIHSVPICATCAVSFRFICRICWNKIKFSRVLGAF